MKKKSFGAMLDLSRNAVMKPDEIKNFAKILKSFGYDAIYLYTEDTYEIPEEPYFGYLRGRLSKDEIKDVVSYCESIGVEVIPCIQTLAHLNQIFHWPYAYARVRDTNDILLVDEERTYELIERMFKTVRECYKTDVINIGMDEAHMLGRGKYLDIHGYTDRFTLLVKHLKKVMAIAEKYGFKPTMWSDMFFRIKNGGNYYVDKYDKKMLDEIKPLVPDGVTLCYWDYYHDYKKNYDVNIKSHKALSDDISFAGAAQSSRGFAPYNKLSIKRTGAAMDACREHGIDTVLITIWGDDGKECSFYSCLPALLYMKERYDGNKNLSSIKKKFFDIIGVPFDDFMKLDCVNQVGGECEGSIAKSMLFNDPLCGVLDGHIKLGDGAIYKGYAKKLAAAEKRAKEFAYVFKPIKDLAKVLELKLDLSLKTRKAYNDKNTEELQKIADKVYPALIKRLDAFYASFCALWEKENKPFGFEVQDARIGGLRQRLIHCRKTIKDYLDGKTENIPELEGEVLAFVPGLGYKVTTHYNGVVSANII